VLRTSAEADRNGAVARPGIRVTSGPGEEAVRSNCRPEACATNMRVRELAEWLGATFEGDGEKELTGVAPLESASANEVAFVGNRKAAALAESSAAGCLIVPTEWPSPSYRTVIRAAEPRTAFARAMNRFYPTAELKPGVHPTAVVGADVEMGAMVHVGAHAVI